MKGKRRRPKGSIVNAGGLDATSPARHLHRATKAAREAREHAATLAREHFAPPDPPEVTD